eukprot:TRINITY_DN21461_c0_g1_i1.p1 TRINITY_DN21461_c0_g1~~TRINITY_DN21461_c0_g1_i1.p1  ORF type:complete len:533 (+),score=137.63 TRINITY_DN21461_c0_g1_i1:33-1631(+)
MDLLAAYGEDGTFEQIPTVEEPIPAPKKDLVVRSSKIDIAPSVSYSHLHTVQNYESPSSAVVAYNPEYDAMWAPVQGPSHPILAKDPNARPNNTINGFVETIHMNHYTFDSEMHNYTRSKETDEKKEKRKRHGFGKANDLEGFQGPWAKFEDEEEYNKQYQVAADEVMTPQEAEEIKKETAEAKKTKVSEPNTLSTSSEFFGGELRDYLGRSYVDPPSHLKPRPHDCYLPKKIIHSYEGYTQGVSVIRFAPSYGHLLIAGGLDGMVKIYDVYNKKNILRSFKGHTKAVKDICFTNDSRRFITAGYDRCILLWDTETGECLGSYTNGSIPYCAKFNPDTSRQHVFLAGCSDKKIVQFDTNSGKIAQTYDQHLGAVNNIVFVDGNRRFVSSSDDKSLRVWEWGIPVVIKYISEPHMHSMPQMAVHPDGQYFAAQSMDNQIVVYSTQNKFKIAKKKRFTGHMVAGYACGIDFSPDGHWLVSGDSDGKLYFWDWVTGRMMKNPHGHDHVAIGVQWHPIEPSRIASCGWDGKINLWD